MERHIASEMRLVMVQDSKVGQSESLNREAEEVTTLYSKFNAISYTKGIFSIYIY